MGSGMSAPQFEKWGGGGVRVVLSVRPTERGGGGYEGTKKLCT